ncbi:hypothetical protein CDL12_05206 [Handroanthus impetiginosus]|uniref:Transmembrane protein n=1 Tax=Handroanthus impetiginosus TaxID=429701 RepID=A0A2G9HX26_9LAMI|nr:hypothetical protein CDL12_05206 [Handroanthus impetiginosus]
MDFYKFFDFLVILKESIKLVTKNGKLVLLLTTLSLLFYSIFFLIFDFSSSSLMRDMLAKESLIPISTPQTADFTNRFSGIEDKSSYVRIIYVSFVLSYFFITFLSTVALILVSSDSYNSNALSLKGSFFSIVKPFTRAFFSGFYTTIFVIGYVFLIISMAATVFMSLELNYFSMIDYAVLVIIVSYIFYLYLSSVWIMSIVVSVVEEDGSGIEALGKSAKIMKGQKIDGFLLNITLHLVSLAVYLCSKMISGEKYWVWDTKITVLVLANGSCLVNIFTFVAYTVMYYRGKERRGQEIELNLSNFEYTKLGSTPLVNGV